LFLPLEPAFSLEERIELDTPVELLDALMFVVNVMLEQLILCSLTVSPAQPTNERQIWLKLLHLDLEAHPLQAAILAVVLEASGSLAARESDRARRRIGDASDGIARPQWVLWLGTLPHQRQTK
jgi:hypothetical protein